jgi:hypothetical protein
MARVTIKDITEGGSLNIEDVNETIESWNDASKQINGDNVRVQGLDQRVFGPVIRKPPTAYTSGSGAGWVPHSPTLDFLPVKTTGADAVIRPGWLPSEGDTLIIRASFQFYVEARGGRPAFTGHSSTPTARFRLEYGDTQNWYELNTTERRFQMSKMYSDNTKGWLSSATFSGSGPSHPYGFNWDNSAPNGASGDTPTEQTCTIIHLVEPGEVGKVSNVPRFRIAYLTANSDMTISGVPKETEKVYIGWLNFNSTVYRR